MSDLEKNQLAILEGAPRRDYSFIAGLQEYLQLLALVVESDSRRTVSFPYIDPVYAEEVQ